MKYVVILSLSLSLKTVFDNDVISTVSKGGIDYAAIIGGGNEIRCGEELLMDYWPD